VQPLGSAASHGKELKNMIAPGDCCQKLIHTRVHVPHILNAVTI